LQCVVQHENRMFEIEDGETVSRESVAPAHTSTVEGKSRLRVKVGISGSPAAAWRRRHPTLVMLMMVALG
jgi:hypothetical protein